MLQYFRPYLILFTLIFAVSVSHAQLRENIKWKALIGLGVNHPLSGGFIDGAEAQSVNFPTVNLGIQYMFKRQYGVKLDYGFNRFKNDSEAPEFKVNYSRINAQFVYDPSDNLGFLPMKMRTVAHAGPGIAFAKPLGNLGDNKQTYLNFNIGLEVHYRISKKLSVYSDLSYIHGFTSLDDYNPAISGLGAFNGSVINLTFGIAISLSGCQYCD